MGDSGQDLGAEVIAVGGRFVMMYTASDTSSGKQCIGRAESASPAGPFIDARPAPLVCQSTLGGSIDPNPVVMGSKIRRSTCTGRTTAIAAEIPFTCGANP